MLHQTQTSSTYTSTSQFGQFSFSYNASNGIYAICISIISSAIVICGQSAH